MLKKIVEEAGEFCFAIKDKNEDEDQKKDQYQVSFYI